MSKGRTTILATACLMAGHLAAVPAPGQATTRPTTRPAKTIKAEDHILVTGGKKYRTLLAHPNGEGPFPGVLLLHDCWGLTDAARQQAERLAHRGYAALAVDLYDGRIAKDGSQAHVFMQNLNRAQAQRGANFAYQFLAGHGLTRGKKVGVVGWCVGAELAYGMQKDPSNSRAHMIGVPDPKAIVVCYGDPPSTAADIVRLKCPILAIWAGGDTKDVDAFDRVAKQAGGIEILKRVYPKVRHGFMNAAHKAAFDATATDQAWAEIDKFLNRHVK